MSESRKVLPPFVAANPVVGHITRASGHVAVVLLAGLGLLIGAQWAFSIVLDKPAAPLPHGTLGGKDGLPEVIGPYQRQRDRALPEDVVEALGTHEYLFRDFQDTRKREDELGAFVSLNLNYYAKGSATPHVPEVCWAGNGMQAYGRLSNNLTVADVAHRDGTKSPVVMHVAAFYTPSAARAAAANPFAAASEGERVLNVAYVFQVNGRYTATAQQVQKEFWDPFAKYAYHTKIELTLVDGQGRPFPCTPEQAEPIFAAFLKDTLATIEEYLPDPARLAAQERAAASPDSMRKE